jgi:RNA polymerase sigma factor (TIGR02999 family)
MRQVLVDHARRRDRDKRGGAMRRVSLSLEAPADDSAAGIVDALDLDEALEGLARLSPRQARVAELRYFGGYSVEETAEILAVSERTVKGDWRVARAWLKDELSGGAPEPAASD